MSEKIVLEEIMLDDESIGLAENFKELGETFTTVIGCDDEAESDDIVYFGVDLPIGDIGEVKAKVISCEEDENDEDMYITTLEILALDDRYSDSLEKVLKGKDVSEESEDGQPIWALGLKQTNGAFATLVNCPAGVLSGDQLAKIAEVTKNGAGIAKLTHAQRVILLLKPEQISTVSDELKTVGLRVGVLHAGIRNIRACCGALCQFCQGKDGLSLALEIDKALFGRPMKFDVKIAVSDCLRNCLESYCVDIGLIANAGKYSIFVGGAASSVHYKALKLTGGVENDDVISLIEKILDWYESNANDGERLHKTLTRIGLNESESKCNNKLDAVSSLFEDYDMGYDVTKQLTRSLARAIGVNHMRKDLEL